MRLLIFVLLTAVSAGISVAQEEIAPHQTRAVEGDACPVALPAWASAPETYAWGEICAGRVANMQFATGADDGAGCEALEEEAKWPGTRRLSNRFLRLVTARAPYTEVTVRPAVRIRCAVFSEQIDLSDESVPLTLRINSSRVPRGLHVADSRFGGDLDLDGSALGLGAITAWGLRVEDDLFLRNGQFAGVSLLGARVGGDLSAIGSSFAKHSNADRLAVGGNLFMRGGADFAAVDLLGARVGGDLSTNGSRFAGHFNADRLAVDGGLFMRGGAEFVDVDLVGARVGGTMTTIGSRFSGLLNADRLIVGGSLLLRGKAEFAAVDLVSARVGSNLETDGSRFAGHFDANRILVGGSMYLRAGAEFTTIDLVEADIAGHLQFQGSDFNGRVDATGAEIGELVFGRRATDARWGEDVSLILRNVETGALQARMPESFVREDGSRVPLDLAGFRYDRLGGLGSGIEHDLSRVDVASLIDWIEGPLPGGGDPDDGYAPQPYRQLAQTLRAMGAEEQADAVAYARHLHRARSRPDTAWGWIEWSGDQTLRALAGFGIHPFRVLWWFAGLVVIGTFVARSAPALCTSSRLDCFWYSLENALPLVEATDEHKAVEHAGRAARSFFHFQKVAGFALATILVGALTLLGG